ncbi:MAG: ABC transporter substrate-binding protein [Blastocatellia bacterium AA13]|nr:MAG: ABC transporter substrate-binding protein [Blastocatellia bacterium AA13]
MRTFVIRRLLALIPLLLVVTFLTQALLVASPGNYVDRMREGRQFSEEFIQQLTRQYHLETENVFVRYWYWLGQTLQGNFGYSFAYKISVWSLLWQRTLNTLLLAIASLLISWGLAIPLGMLAAVKRDTWVDKLAGIFSFAGLSIPSVFFSLLMLLFASKTGLFPIGDIHDQVYWGNFSPLQKLGDVLWHLVLPSMVLGLIGTAQFMRQMRSQTIEVLSQDYIRTAKAKGLSPSRILFRHAFSNAVNPIVTLFGFSLAFLLAGAVLTETVFSWPGMGRLTVDALINKDEPLIMASVVLLTVMLAFGSLASDILLAVIDPRIRLDGN